MKIIKLGIIFNIFEEISRMKIYISITLLSIAFSFNSFSQEIILEAPIDSNMVELNWSDSFKDAIKKSKKEKKPILIYFTGSDWCGICKQLNKNLFYTDKFKNLADKDLILYEADNPNNKDLISPDKMKENYKLIRKYKVKGQPTIVMVNHRGKMIGYKKGKYLTEYYYSFFQSVVENY
jgi:thioredoxin-related protein